MDAEGKLCFMDAKEFRKVFDIKSRSKNQPNSSDKKPILRDMFKNVYTPGLPQEAGGTTVKRSWTERQMYRAFINVVAKNKLCPEYKFTLSANKGDKDDPTKQRVDVAMFKGKAPKDGAPHWDEQALWVEFKRDDVADPFKGNTLAPKSTKREDTWAQLITYAARIFETQHRTHLYSVLICGPTAYIMRWDRSGVIVTEGFNYIKEDELLADFLSSFVCMSPAQQGYDTTVEPVEPGSADYKAMDNAVETCKDTLDYVKGYFKASLVGGARRWRVRVEGYEQPFLIGNPHFRSWGVFGRGTKGFVAYEAKKEKFFWLKDTWRIDLDGMEKEGKIILELEEAGVENIPTVVCHEDVLHEINGERIAQSTLAHEYLRKAHQEARKERKAKTVETKRRLGRAAAGNKAKRSSKQPHSEAKKSKGRKQANEASSTGSGTSVIDGSARSDEQERVVGQSSDGDGEENGASTSGATRAQQQARSGSPHADEAANDGDSTVEEAAQSPITGQEAAHPFTSKDDVSQHSTPAKGLVESPAIEQPQAQSSSLTSEDGGTGGQNLSNVASSSSQKQISAEDEDPDTTPVGAEPLLRSYTHYRLVEEEVGMRLEEFDNGFQLTTTVTDALEAHSQAVSKASRIHRDVSPNNIVVIFYKTATEGKFLRRGILCDWEFSKRIEDDPTLEQRRQINRTGTWQFQSAIVLLQPAKSVEIADELEAFFYVLLYCSLRYIHNTCRDLVRYMSNLFDLAVFSNDDYWCPILKYHTVAAGELIWLAKEIHFLSAGVASGGTADKQPLNAIFSTLLNWFKARYVVAEADGTLAPPEYLIRAAHDELVASQTSARDSDVEESEEDDETSQLQTLFGRKVGQRDLFADDHVEQEQLDDATSVVERKRAVNLESHDPMLNLLARAISKQKWPAKDGAGDQLPGHTHGKILQADDPDAIATRTRQRKRNANASIDENGSNDIDERPAKRQRKIPALQLNRASASRGTKRGASDDDNSDGPFKPPAKRVRTLRTAAPASQLHVAPAASGSSTSRPRPASKPSSRTRKTDISMSPPLVPAPSRGSANAPVASGSRPSRSRAAQDQSSTDEAADGAINVGTRRSGRLSAKDKGKARAY
ncbi:uncharacterized protein LAESUDRAFT_682627 [Laetiporus sulphureus 93-53]|uniref:Fungal-type protein kinase domain-containing protein n=1 Tax=Laetiporus sulphureus 93-53 TaxID=1314785 RepID=A0A165DAY1_9APHY|nr:uncharacterized protein LAESUDRAFT_682627 [Laetiporus sulphureus 93-53]KZT04459.1 hypothetical protein LAESUDRAFT_682627 [Laetiporus sulphureus 93-53]